MPTYPFAEWVAEQFRLTAFVAPAVVNHPAEEWWQEATGSAPEESTAHPKVGVRILASPFLGGKLTLRFEPGRIDWFLTPPEPGPESFGEPLMIGPVVEIVDSFSAIIDRWLRRNDLPSILRIAFGGVARHPEADMRSGYNRLPDYLPVRIGPDATDFFFQINNPAQSQTAVQGLRINRLSKWSISSLVRMSLQMGSGMLVPNPAPVLGYALRVELDVNTFAEFQGPLPSNNLVEVYRELVAAARAIVTDGLNPQ